MRGKRTICQTGLSCLRITPACAGKTECRKQILRASKDHPRVCGENMLSKPIDAVKGGSPPRVRGKPTSYGHYTSNVGITPACAGKTQLPGFWVYSDRDHPRVCGENRNRHGQQTEPVGSPPRVRGKRGIIAGGRGELGITPACAGKTKIAVALLVCGQDHPRVCGENGSSFRIRSIAWGSPPRVRGKHRVAQGQFVQRGITPACAGKTLKRSLNSNTFSGYHC